MIFQTCYVHPFRPFVEGQSRIPTQYLCIQAPSRIYAFAASPMVGGEDDCAYKWPRLSFGERGAVSDRGHSFENDCREKVQSDSRV